LSGDVTRLPAADLRVDKNPRWQLSFLDPKEVHNFQMPLFPKPFNFGYRCFGIFFGIVEHKEHPPEVWSVPPVTPCIFNKWSWTADKEWSSSLAVGRGAGNLLRFMCLGAGLTHWSRLSNGNGRETWYKGCTEPVQVRVTSDSGKGIRET